MVPKILLFVAGAAVTLSALFVRQAGLDPESLWYDDLVWGAIARAGTMGEVLRVPAHAAPGFFLVLRGMRALFGDPEWSLQLVPFVAGIAAIPVIAWLVRRLTASDGLALLAAALTALNPLLAHYTIYVKPYSLDFLTTALFMIGGIALLGGREVTTGRLVRLVMLSGVGLLVSVTSVFMSAPLVNLAALRAWLDRRRAASRVVWVAAAYDACLLAAFLVLRRRSNSALLDDFRDNFIPFSSAGDVGAFLRTEGTRMLRAGLPSPPDSTPWNPELVPWLLPFVGLGFVWLLARRASRNVAWLLAGFGGALLAANAMRLYPIGGNRTAIFAFPVAIALCVMGVHLVTEWTTRREVLRAAIGLAVAAWAVAVPVRVAYWPSDGVRLVCHIVTHAAPSDGLVLSNAAAYLVAFYGPWRVTISENPAMANATAARVDRDVTLHLPPNVSPVRFLDAFLEDVRPERVWYVDLGTSDADDVRRVLAERGYVLTEGERSVTGGVLLGVAGRAPPA